ncbi:MAG TPA: hypothetical protein DD827_04485, partial [Gammaproteobacteria bacterium]|nr:hypothetical protein [Gammaproteobacteria bacterium]
ATGSEYALDWLGGSAVFPVLGREVVEGGERGRNVYTLAQMRMNGEGSLYVQISDVVDARVLRKMR